MFPQLSTWQYIFISAEDIVAEKSLLFKIKFVVVLEPIDKQYLHCNVFIYRRKKLHATS